MPKTATTLAAALCLLTGAVLAAQGEQTLTPLPERPLAPEFDLPGPGGEPYRLADWRGKPIIVNFWATWCPPCRKEMPSMQRAWEAVRDEGIVLLAINVGEDAETVQRFLRDFPVGFPLPMDERSQVVQAWPVKGLPTTFVVDPEGRLAYIATGEREWDDPVLLDQVRALRTE